MGTFKPEKLPDGIAEALETLAKLEPVELSGFLILLDVQRAKLEKALEVDGLDQSPD